MTLPQHTGGEPPPIVVSVASALHGLPVTANARLAEVHLTSPVATTLRAALDLVLAGNPPLRPLGVSTDDATLEVRCTISQAEALAVAGGLLEAIEGSLARARTDRGEWTLRVPLAVARPTFLMLTQGTLRIAVPWHAVVRVRLVPARDIDAAARREGAQRIQPFAEAPDPGAERPVVLIALGLKRALLVADRLIWRLPAEPIDDPGLPRGRSLTNAVSTQDGEVYWVVDLAELMRDVEIPGTLKIRDVTPVVVDPAPEPVQPRVEQEEASPAAPASPAVSEAAPTPAPDVVVPAPPATLLDAEAVSPLPMPGAVVIQEVPSPVEDRLTPGAALVVEDSIIGRMFLARLLERRGYEVETVTMASQLDDALARGPWSLVLVDVDLPDSGEARHLRSVVEAAAANRVALVRDADDEALALAHGIHLHLRKPFEADALDELLAILESNRKEP